MPTLAALFVSETSLKIGSLAANVPPAVTSDETPLTEIFAVAARADGRAGSGSAVGSGRGSAMPADGPPETAAGCEARPSAAFSACCANGSLLSKRSKVISVPCVAAGAGSESTSAAAPPAGAAGVAAAGTAAPAAGAPGAAEGDGGGAGSVATLDELPPKRPRIVGAW